MEYLGILATIAGMVLVGVMSPGPNFAIVTSAAVTRSRRAGVMTGLGLGLATFTWALLAIAGFGLIIAGAAWAVTLARVAGAVYLIWIGARMMLGARQPIVDAPLAQQRDGLGAVSRGFVVSMTNPKAIVFYASIFAVMVPSHAPLWVNVAIVVLSTLVSVMWYCGVAWFFSSGKVRLGYLRARPVIETLLGLFLIVVGGRLLVSV